MANAPADVVIRVRDLIVDLKTHRVLNGVDLDVFHGDILGFVGASGAGKSVLMRTIIGLLRKRQGLIEVFGVDLDQAEDSQRQAIDRRWGILFQQGALFSSLTVGKNVEFPIREYLDLSDRLTTEMAITKLEMVGLQPDVYRKYPSELSGGMIKRVALARALALDPEILFLDEPTSGLDPISAGEFDQLILTLQQTLTMAVFMVTHDLDSLHTVCNRIAVLGDGKIIESGTMEKMLASEHPWLKAYFHGARAHADPQVSVTSEHRS
jgi:phospholipid/cholesterol/gamma-HCH transport system ATP-binding protein